MALRSNSLSKVTGGRASRNWRRVFPKESTGRILPRGAVSAQSEYLNTQCRYPAAHLNDSPPTSRMSEQDCIQRGKEWRRVRTTLAGYCELHQSIVGNRPPGERIENPTLAASGVFLPV